MKKILIALSSVIVISGCSSSQMVPESTIISELDTSTNVTSLEELKRVSVEARDEMRLLAKAKDFEVSKNLTETDHEQRYFQATHIPKGFEKVVNYKYTNRAHKVAKSLAQLAGYKLIVDGKPAANEPWVSIDLKNEPLNEALKELGIQTGDTITVEIHEPAKVMRFIYIKG